MSASLLCCRTCPGVAMAHAILPHCWVWAPHSDGGVFLEGANLKLVSSPLWAVEWAGNEFESSRDRWWKWVMIWLACLQRTRVLIPCVSHGKKYVVVYYLLLWHLLFTVGIYYLGHTSFVDQHITLKYNRHFIGILKFCILGLRSPGLNIRKKVWRKG